MDELKGSKFFKEFDTEDEKWKRKNEDFFSTGQKKSQLIFICNFADFRYAFRFFLNFFNQKFLQSKTETGCSFCLFLAIFYHFKPTLDCNFWSKKDMKNLNTYLKSAKFKVSRKYKLKYLSQIEKIFIFFFFIFHFHIRILWKFLQPFILPLRIIFSTRYCF